MTQPMKLKAFAELAAATLTVTAVAGSFAVFPAAASVDGQPHLGTSVLEAQPKSTSQWSDSQAQDDEIRSTFSLQAEAVKASSHSFCTGNLTRWRSLINHRPSVNLQRELNQQDARWHIHAIENARDEINLDYYSVIINQLPPDMSADQLLSLMRKDLNSFIDTSLAVFSPYATADATRWSSNNPLGSVLSIELDITPDSASVVTSDVSNQSWTFSTLWTTKDYGHPVSGNRRFGYFEWNGNLVFYTRGADRVTNAFDDFWSEEVFEGGDNLWKSFQSQLTRFVNTYGGSARTGRTVSHRCDWNNVRSRYYNPSTPWL